MIPRKIIILLFVIITLNKSAFGQEIPAKTDSTRIYKDIESLSKQRKITKFFYGLIFKATTTITPKKKGKKKTYNNLVQRPYSAFEGKTIRSITIETLDPFGYSITESKVKTQNILTRSGNYLHVKSLDLTIRNLLLIHKNQSFDSLLVKESERLVRSMGYVRDVSFYVKGCVNAPDSVDIYIRSLDRWSITPDFGYSPSKIALGLGDNNFMGLGHEFKNSGAWHPDNDDYSFQSNYYVPNIRNTYISTRLSYARDEAGNFNKQVGIDRPFFSPYARWAAGINMANEFRKDSILNLDSVFIHQRFNYKTQDYWAGYALQIFKGTSENSRTTNFISAARILRIHYLERPSQNYDAEYKYSDENLYLASFGISTRKYVQDKYIFKYGLTEDVPVGKVLGITGGYQEKNNIGRIYLGARFAHGNYYSWGYLSSNFEYGTFIYAGHSQQGAISVGLNYYTGLFEVGRWKIRQFIKPQLTMGIHRFSNDSLNLNEGYGLDGFKSAALWGSRRMIFTLQTQMYTPWNIIGFRFGPYVSCSVGMLGDEYTGFKNSPVYSQIGLGVLIKNENLVINTFQFSLSFYPLLPGDGQNTFKTNSIRTNDFGFRDFEIGKPAVVVFQ